MVKFSRRARADIRGIWSYAIDYWGKGQAEIYLALIEQAVDAIVENPELGRPCDEVQRGCRKYLVGSHLLFYRIKGKTILVARVLHGRMNAERHF